MELQFLNLLAFVLSIVAASAERDSSLRRLEDSPDKNREAGVPKACQIKCRSIPINRLKAGCEDTCKIGKGGWTRPSKGALKCVVAESCSEYRGALAKKCKSPCYDQCAKECIEKYGEKDILTELCQYGCSSVLNLHVMPVKPDKPEAGVPKACQIKCRSIPINRLKAGCEDMCKIGKGKDYTWPSKKALKCVTAASCSKFRGEQAKKCRSPCLGNCGKECVDKFGEKDILTELCRYECSSV